MPHRRPWPTSSSGTYTVTTEPQLTLTCASKIGLVEPDYVRKTEEHVFACISRIHQRNHKTVTYRMICPDVQVKAMILEWQRQQDLF